MYIGVIMQYNSGSMAVDFEQVIFSISLCLLLGYCVFISFLIKVAIFCMFLDVYVFE